MAKKTKANLEFLLVKAELKGIPEKALLKSMVGRCLDRNVFKQVEQEMQENSWRFASASHTSVSPVLHAKIQ